MAKHSLGKAIIASTDATNLRIGATKNHFVKTERMVGC
jgi:hypothetical protein